MVIDIINCTNPKMNKIHFIVEHSIFPLLIG